VGDERGRGCDRDADLERRAPGREPEGAEQRLVRHELDERDLELRRVGVDVRGIEDDLEVVLRVVAERLDQVLAQLVGDDHEVVLHLALPDVQLLPPAHLEHVVDVDDRDVELRVLRPVALGREPHAVERHPVALRLELLGLRDEARVRRGIRGQSLLFCTAQARTAIQRDCDHERVQSPHAPY
jgi:hypothetical protein